MTSFAIPEEIIPGKIFVPSDNNFFEIGTGSLPNGQDSLVVRGDLDRNFKAFQVAQTLSPDIFNTRTAVGWSMSFWVKIGAITLTGTGFHSDQFLFGVMSLNASNSHTSPLITTAPSVSGANGQIPHLLWGVVGHCSSSGVSQSRIGFVKQTHFRGAPGLSGGQSDNISFSLTANTWTQIIINLPSPAYTAPTGFANLSSVSGVHDNGGFSSLILVTGTQYLCIGSYGDGSQMNGRSGQWEIAKLAFHPTVLTITEATALYNAMTT